MKDKQIRYLNPRFLKMLLFVAVDIVVIILSYILGYLVQYNAINLEGMLFAFCIAVFHIIIFTLFDGYRIVTDNFGMADALRFCAIIIFNNIIAALANRFVPTVPRLSLLIFGFVTSFQILLIIGSRCVQRIHKFYTSTSKDAVPTMIIGAGAAGKIAFDEMHSNVDFNNKVVCFGDVDPDKIGKKYLGKPVAGPLDKAHEIIEKYGVKEVVIAISRLDRKHLNEIIAQFANENVKIRRLPLLTELTDPTKPMHIKDVSLEEVLGREQITFDTTQIQEWINGKTVLVTGGGGSIGGELALQCVNFKCKKLVLFDIYENATYDVQQNLLRKIKRENLDTEIIAIIGSTYNKFRVEEIFAKYRPDIVFHAAAYKHVPLMEDSPVEAIRTNCLGTYNVAEMADKYQVQKMVLVSTDKAVRPTNTMGATKAFAEMIIRYWDERSANTLYSAVRFGNVLGSNGSVIPLFKKQIAEGGPVTVTHKDIIRYFMTIPEAVSLILQSGAFATGGEIFILDMGKPVKILTLAENVIRQCGYVPYKDINIIFTGLRPGEKLYEELLLDVTKNTKTSNEKIFVEEKKKILPMDEKIQFISKVFTMTDNDEIKNCLREVVTSYTYYKDFNAKIISEQLNVATNNETKDKVGVN